MDPDKHTRDSGKYFIKDWILLLEDEDILEEEIS